MWQRIVLPLILVSLSLAGCLSNTRAPVPPAITETQRQDLLAGFRKDGIALLVSGCAYQDGVMANKHGLKESKQLTQKIHRVLVALFEQHNVPFRIVTSPRLCEAAVYDEDLYESFDSDTPLASYKERPWMNAPAIKNDSTLKNALNRFSCVSWHAIMKIRLPNYRETMAAHIKDDCLDKFIPEHLMALAKYTQNSRYVLKVSVIEPSHTTADTVLKLSATILTMFGGSAMAGPSSAERTYLNLYDLRANGVPYIRHYSHPKPECLPSDLPFDLAERLGPILCPAS